jgi:hypothetical protein
MVRTLLRLEGLAVLLLSLYGYAAVEGRWLWYAVLFLTPDLSAAGYLANPRAGSVAYNVVHTYLAPAALLGAGWIFRFPVLTLAGLILGGHIGLDRFLGFGLKYPSAFKDTHIQRA